MNIKSGILITIAIAATLMTFFNSIAIASPGGHCQQMQLSPEKMHARIKARLDKLAERLEIKSSQQSSWEEFAKSVEMLPQQDIKKPDDDADAATISRYRAERATEHAKRLTGIADATAKLQMSLTENQRKILNQLSHHFLHKEHLWNRGNQEQSRGNLELQRCDKSDGAGQHDRRNNSW